MDALGHSLLEWGLQTSHNSCPLHIYKSEKTIQSTVRTVSGITGKTVSCIGVFSGINREKKRKKINNTKCRHPVLWLAASSYFSSGSVSQMHIKTDCLHLMLWIIATWLNPFLRKIKNFILFLGKQTSLKSTKHVSSSTKSCFWSLFMSSDFNRPCQTMPTSHINEISLNQIHLRCIFVLLGVKTEYISLDKICTDTPVNKSIQY